MPGGAVVLLQTDDPAALILLLKGQDILNGGPPEAIDRLVIVTHHAEVFVAPRQKRGQEILQVVGVLILVDEYIAELFLIIFPHVLKLLEQTDGVEDDVVKVQGVGLPQAALILHVDVGDLGQAKVPAGLALGQILVGQQHGVLGPGDVAQHGPGRELLVIHVQVLHGLLDDPQGVVGVIDGKGGGKAQLLDVPAQDAHAGGVEGGGPHVLPGGAKHPGQAVLQLPGGLVGKGDGQNGPGLGGVQAAQPLPPVPVLRGQLRPLGAALQKGQVVGGDPLGDLRAVRAPAIAHQVGDAVDEHGGLSAARPGQQQQRPLGGEHRLLLLIVQPVKVPGDGLAAGGGKSNLLFVVKHDVTFRSV